VGLDTR